MREDMHGPVTLDQSRIFRFAAVGTVVSFAVMLAIWATLRASGLAPVATAAEGGGPIEPAAAACCPPGDGPVGTTDAAGAAMPGSPALPAAPADPAASPPAAGAPDAVASGPAWLLDTTGFPRRWNCGTWTAELGWIHVIGDASIWGAYMAIPAILGIFVLRGGSPLPAPIWLFIAFIATCGFGHLMESVIFWEPVYRLAGVWKWLIAVVSWATVAAILPAVPQVLRWPRLADLNRELAVLNQSLEQERQQVERANARLRDTNAELEQFVYSASHDLKSPLVTISGFLTHLQRDLEAGRQQSLAGHVERISRSTARMKACVDDLLEVSRVGHVTEELELVRLDEAFDRLRMMFRDRLRAAGATLESDFDVDEVLVTPSHLDRALMNLVDNAIRYAGEGEGAAPRITVGSRREAGETRVFVADDGPGVPAEHHDRIFELFQRLSSDGEGTGVGLTVVQRVAGARGGRAWVESAAGEGATFWMSFPDASEPGAVGSAASATATAATTADTADTAPGTETRS